MSDQGAGGSAGNAIHGLVSFLEEGKLEEEDLDIEALGPTAAAYFIRLSATNADWGRDDK